MVVTMNYVFMNFSKLPFALTYNNNISKVRLFEVVVVVAVVKKCVDH